MAKGTNCNCLHGTPTMDANGNCGCISDEQANCDGVWIDGIGCTGGIRTISGSGGVSPNAPVPPFQSSAFLEKVLNATGVNPNSGARDVPVNAGALGGGGLLDMLKAHPLLIGGGIALAIYFLFFRGGLGAADRTVTSVTKYLPSTK